MYTQKHYTCPLCKKALTDMRGYYRQIDLIMNAPERQGQIPPEFAKRRSLVLCHDCGGQSTAQFDFVYHKCRAGDGSCGSYNTQLLQTSDDPAALEEIAAKSAEAAAASATAAGPVVDRWEIGVVRTDGEDTGGGGDGRGAGASGNEDLMVEDTDPVPTRERSADEPMRDGSDVAPGGVPR